MTADVSRAQGNHKTGVVGHTFPVCGRQRLDVDGVRDGRVEVQEDPNLGRWHQHPHVVSSITTQPTFCPSVNPNTLPNAESTSTTATSWSLADAPMPSLPTTGASLRLLGIPVHPRYDDRCTEPLDREPDERYCSSTMTFCAVCPDVSSSRRSGDGGAYRVGVDQQGDQRRRQVDEAVLEGHQGHLSRRGGLSGRHLATSTLRWQDVDAGDGASPDVAPPPQALRGPRHLPPGHVPPPLLLFGISARSAH